MALSPNMHLQMHVNECIENCGHIYGFRLLSFKQCNGILGSYQTNNTTVEVKIVPKFFTSGILWQMQHILPRDYNNFSESCQTVKWSMSLNSNFVDTTLLFEQIMGPSSSLLRKQSVWADFPSIWKILQAGNGSLPVQGIPVLHQTMLSHQGEAGHRWGFWHNKSANGRDISSFAESQGLGLLTSTVRLGSTGTNLDIYLVNCCFR